MSIRASITRPSIIDVEASGFGSASYPIEVGVVTGDDDRYCSLVQPAEHWTHWDDRAQQVHHIERDQLQRHGHCIVEVAGALNDLLEGKTVYTDGWVVDYPWLVTLFEAASMEMAFTVSSLEMILSECQMEVWHQTHEEVMRESGMARHRASNDAWVIQETWCRTRMAQAGIQ